MSYERIEARIQAVTRRGMIAEMAAPAFFTLPLSYDAASKSRPARTSATQLSLDAVNDATLTAAVGPNSRGAAVLRAQVLLDRARFSPGEIDAAFGSNLQKAIAAFQRSNGLDATRSSDQPTWSAPKAADSPRRQSRSRNPVAQSVGNDDGTLPGAAGERACPGAPGQREIPGGGKNTGFSLQPAALRGRKSPPRQGEDRARAEQPGR